MGYWKSKMIEEQEQGWSFIGDKYVCENCFNDYALARFVRENAIKNKCDYCGRKSKRLPIAAPIDAVMVKISEGIHYEWGNPDNIGMPYESAEGGYQGKVIDAHELIKDRLYDIFENENLLQDIYEAFNSQGAIWCNRYLWSLPSERLLRYGWDEFANVVKYSVRYLFLRASNLGSDYRDHDEIPPHLFLDKLGEVVSDVGLVRTLFQGTRIFRVRAHERGIRLKTVGELGPPPIDKAIYSNRMSPAGIPMFYGAFDRDTAINETYDRKFNSKSIVTCTVFETARDFPVLDLTRLSKIPSIFDSNERNKRPGIIFLQNFAKDLSKEIKKDGLEHIEYVPTQVVTEYFRHVYVDPELGKVCGILYASSQNPDGMCCVLFFQSEQCCEIVLDWSSVTLKYRPTEPQYWLGLDTDSLSVFYPYSKRNKRAESHSKQKRQIPR